MCEMKGYSPREFRELLEKNGWSLSHCRGSHQTFSKPYCSYHITYSNKGKELSRPLVKRIIKEAGLVT